MKNGRNRRKGLIVFALFVYSILSFSTSYPGVASSSSGSTSSSLGSGGIAQPPKVQPLLGDTGMGGAGDPGALPVGDNLLPLVGSVLLYGVYKKLRKKTFLSN
jgi:hypothetical protein